MIARVPAIVSTFHLGREPRANPRGALVQQRERPAMETETKEPREVREKREARGEFEGG